MLKYPQIKPLRPYNLRGPLAFRQELELKGIIVKAIHFSPKKAMGEFQDYIKITGIPFSKINLRIESVIIRI